MAIQNVIGTFPWRYLGFYPCSGGVGWGEVINGGFGMVLTAQASRRIESMLFWDVNCGLESWAPEDGFAIKEP
jgi:urocanate hydratase